MPLQVGASLLVLGSLLREADPASVGAALAASSIGWLFVATALKTVGVSLHELRLWLALRPYKADVPLRPVFGIGYLAGLLNVVLPVRGGDLVAVALLRTELKVSGPTALAAVALTSFFEAGVFAVFLLGVMAFGATQWEALLGGTQTVQAMGSLTLVTLGAVFGGAALVVVGRKLSAKPQTRESDRPSIMELLKESVVRTGQGLSAWRLVLVNLLLAALQVALIVASFWALLPATGLELEYPILATCGIIAVGAMAAIVLPPGLGAGAAAAAVFVLGFFGVGEAEAIAFTALSWVANSLPPVLTGFVPLVRRVGRVKELLAGPS